MTPMTEEEWNSWTNPTAMVVFLQDKASNRKMRLYTCACIRRVWAYVRNENDRQGIHLVEQYADGLVSAENVNTWIASHFHLPPLDRHLNYRTVLSVIEWDPDYMMFFLSYRADPRPTEVRPVYPHELKHIPVHEFDLDWYAGNADKAALLAAAANCRHIQEVEFDHSIEGPGFKTSDPKAVNQAYESERTVQAQLLRHIMGNPYKPYPAPASWPSAVVQLATSLYEGQQCRLPLSDALEEAGHPELAEHFRKEEWHPKGCWVLDLILNKQRTDATTTANLN
jgi:hypothetical protein